MEALIPRTSPEWAEVPCPGATTSITPLLTALLDFATFFLASDSGMDSFPYKSTKDLLFLMGEVLGISCLGCFSRMMRPLVTKVVALEPFTILASFYRSIILDMAAKVN